MEVVPTKGFVFAFSLLAGVTAAGVWGAAFYVERRHPGRAVCFFLGVSAWLAFTAFLGWSGALQDFTASPPPALPFFFLGMLGTAALCLSSVGWRFASGLPLWVLVGFQGFRVPLELLLHRGGRRGSCPCK